jgi:hypothetical protein
MESVAECHWNRWPNVHGIGGRMGPEYATPKEIEEIVKMVRLNLYNRDLFCGAQAILWEVEELGIKPLPSLRTINRILSRGNNGDVHL